MKLVRWLVCFFFFLGFFLFGGYVCAVDDPVPPTLGPIAPPPIENPVPTIGETKPVIIICGSVGAYCYKCNFNEDNPTFEIDMPYAKMPCNAEELAALEAEGYYCPFGKTRGDVFGALSEYMVGDMRDMRNLLEAIGMFIRTGDESQISLRQLAYVLYQEVYTIMFECMGRTYICDDSKPWPDKCKELNCDVYGQCEWDEEINHCYSPEAYADQDVPDIRITPVPIELNRAVCWDCANEEETLRRCISWPWCIYETNNIWNPRDDYVVGTIREIFPNLPNTLGSYFISDCGITYPMCQSFEWDYDVHEMDGFVGRLKASQCEINCKNSIGIFPPGQSCFGGDPVYYGCENYPSDDDLPDDNESAMCRKVTEDQSPTCGLDGTCWTWPECNTTCQGFYYCNSSITPVCQLGYYKDLADCEDKNDGGCYETRLGCLSECGCGEDGCGPTLNEPPKIEIGDGGMNPAVNIPGDGRFHICDSDFWLDSVNAPHQAYFKVEINHSESAQKIDVIALGFNHVENGETVYDLWLPVIGLSANSGSGPGGLFVQGEELDKVEVTSITENLSGSPDEKGSRCRWQRCRLDCGGRIQNNCGETEIFRINPNKNRKVSYNIDSHSNMLKSLLS